MVVIDVVGYKNKSVYHHNKHKKYSLQHQEIDKCILYFNSTYNVLNISIFFLICGLMINKRKTKYNICSRKDTTNINQIETEDPECTSNMFFL